jgi:hypothetical protein
MNRTVFDQRKPMSLNYVNGFECAFDWIGVDKSFTDRLSERLT